MASKHEPKPKPDKTGKVHAGSERKPGWTNLGPGLGRKREIKGWQ